ncbi:hypothetical protein QFZ48_005832 [Chitinophaga sp. W2I13]|uniref:hypothetical protein n=1 Tax=Chitinophaga sp. W2I13 TaxID=3373923 RepID=UPI003D2485B2
MITLVHQYQRKKDSKGRLITEITDLETAVDVMFDSIVLKVDELDGSLRQFYEQLKGWLQQQHGDKYQNASFGLREIRQSLKFSKTQVFRYASDLTRLEYIQICGGHINRGFTYKLSYCDNYQLLRERIRNYLASQIQSIRASAHYGTLEPLPVLK